MLSSGNDRSPQRKERIQEFYQENRRLTNRRIYTIIKQAVAEDRAIEVGFYLFIQVSRVPFVRFFICYLCFLIE